MLGSAEAYQLTSSCERSFQRSASRSGVSTSRASTRSVADAKRVAAIEATTAVPHPSGPSGLQPKKWLRPGVWMTVASAAVESKLVTTTGRLEPPERSVCTSCDPTRAASATGR